MKKHNKLVRDNIPDIIKQGGEAPLARKLSAKEYKEALREKLVEEAREVKRAKGKEELVKEIGDIEEVLLALMDAHNIECKEVSALRRKRRKERGGFKKRIFLESVK